MNVSTTNSNDKRNGRYTLKLHNNSIRHINCITTRQSDPNKGAKELELYGKHNTISYYAWEVTIIYKGGLWFTNRKTVIETLK